jgi:hypothetical protein
MIAKYILQYYKIYLEISEIFKKLETYEDF